MNKKPKLRQCFDVGERVFHIHFDYRKAWNNSRGLIINKTSKLSTTGKQQYIVKWDFSEMPSAVYANEIGLESQRKAYYKYIIRKRNILKEKNKKLMIAAKKQIAAVNRSLKNCECEDLTIALYEGVYKVREEINNMTAAWRA